MSRLRYPYPISCRFPAGEAAPSPEGDDGLLWGLFREKSGRLQVDQGDRSKRSTTEAPMAIPTRSAQKSSQERERPGISTWTPS